MATILSELEQAFRAAIKAAFGVDAEPHLAVSQNANFGDYQANAAMGLAKTLGEKSGKKISPREVAEQIRAKLSLEGIAETSIAGPGFINIRFLPDWLDKRVDAIRNDPRLGIPAVQTQQTVVVDYSGPNVAKNMHVGHLRPTNIGDAITRVLEFQGQHVIRQNHLGDWGTQFGMLITLLEEAGVGGSAQLSDLETFYKAAKTRFDEDPPFAEKARQAVLRLQSGAERERTLWKQIIEQSRQHFQAVYSRMDIKLTPDDERGESFYNPVLQEVVDELKSSGVAVESEGATVVWVDGFEAPLIIKKTGGGFGYATTDLAAIRYRARALQADRVIYLTDARQSQHFKQFFTAAKRAGWIDHVQTDHVMFGTIFGPDGKPFKSKSGDNIKLNDLLDEAEERALSVVTEKNPEMSVEERRAIAHAVGVGAIKYFDLARDWVGNYAFDWDKILALDGNTAPYLQYAHARIRSIFRKAADAQPGPIKLESPYELALAKHILRMGEMIDLVARELKPHHLCTYLYDLATKFSGFFENCPVIQSPDPIRGSRLALCDAAARALELGLDLLGIQHPDRM